MDKLCGKTNFPQGDKVLKQIYNSNQPDAPCVLWEILGIITDLTPKLEVYTIQNDEI